MPKSVVQCNWYYRNIFEGEALTDGMKARLDMFRRMGELGYDQVPAGSVCFDVNNFEGLTKYSVENICGESLMGMMQTAWERIDPDWMHVHDNCVKTIAAAKKWYDER